jgi:hypothetical protein
VIEIRKPLDSRAQWRERGFDGSRDCERVLLGFQDQYEARDRQA